MRRMPAIGNCRLGPLLTATIAGGCLVLYPPTLRAGEAVVTATDAVVRSAPFEVAPELAHVHAGDKLRADDQPQGPWRRVRLPDGRFGLVHDADVTLCPNYRSKTDIDQKGIRQKLADAGYTIAVCYRHEAETKIGLGEAAFVVDPDTSKGPVRLVRGNPYGEDLVYIAVPAG